MKRIVGSLLVTLVGLLALFLTVGFALGTRAQNYEGWWISLPVGLPLVWTLFGLAWAIGAKRRARPVVGILIALGALEYAGFFAYATFRISRQVAESTSPLAGIGYLALLPLWLMVFLFTLIAWALLRGQNLRGVRSIFLGITGAWIAAWLGFWGVWLSSLVSSALEQRARTRFWGGEFPSLGNFLLTEIVLKPESWVVHAFFLLPAILTLVFALTLRKVGSSGEQ